MKITVLVENSACKSNSKPVVPKHGLSLYIEFADKLRVTWWATRNLPDVFPPDFVSCPRVGW